MRPAGGFTLIELLLVMVILGVVFTLAAINLPGGREARLASETTRLLRLLDTLQYEALLRRHPVGLQIDEQGYQAKMLDPLTLEWVNGTRRLFARHDLSTAGLRLHQEATGAESHEVIPAIWFDAAGMTEPFTLILAYAEGDVGMMRLRSNGLGEVQIE